MRASFLLLTLLYSIALMLLSNVQAATKEGWELSLGLGASYSLDQDITLQLKDQPDITLNGNRESKPFSSPLYYGARVSYWWDDQAIELEGIHHKVYVDDALPTQVEKFEVTDGYNLFYTNYAVNWRGSLILRAGIGGVIAHPDVIIEGDRTFGGYQFAGLSGQVGVEKEFSLTKHWLLSLEGKVSISEADININQGSADVPDTAFHLLGHLKYHFD
ncbi:hypothetical protein A3K86_19900 [Photobacterium jeanii]|uniref:Outer membrane protein beta-barrel domain-containing protein n=1 Tax=Photobacterium jeanii TaxID=858640 RepID=A0A178K3C1_9GAMM|nr:hypothetical protein [Photobacterium jeanii]OAN11224.1 hypothetical protein A3K86_19900 [Photobacterium jeanii]PST90743.1 hypothetical protein C9I91_09010 [Photobacterium jeanii]